MSLMTDSAVFATTNMIQDLDFNEIDQVNGGWRLSMARTFAASWAGSWVYDNGSKILEGAGKTPLPNMGFH